MCSFYLTSAVAQMEGQEEDEGAGLGRVKLAEEAAWELQVGCTRGAGTLADVAALFPCLPYAHMVLG